MNSEKFEGYCIIELINPFTNKQYSRTYLTTLSTDVKCTKKKTNKTIWKVTVTNCICLKQCIFLRITNLQSLTPSYVDLQ